MRRLLLIVGILGVWQQSAGAQATQAGDDAAKVYAQAAKLVRENDAVNIMSPASSNLSFPSFPPFSAEWLSMEKADFAANTEARALAHQARSIDQANWPPRHSNPPVSYLNECRNLSNELADAAVYEQIQGDDAVAIETLRDQWHLADLLRDQPGKTFVRLLVSVGIRAEICNRLEVVTSSVALTKDFHDPTDLQTSAAGEFIAELLQQPDARTELNDVLHDEGSIYPMNKPTVDRLIETCNRVNAECGLAAMSLACHLYKLDTGDWPKSLDDLRGYLPSVPIDPWGDGKPTLGYALVKGGLPDGSDRPLVYSRAGMRDGLFFRTDRPEYGFYFGDGSQRAASMQKQGGQFRDVARWVPVEGSHLGATTQPLD